MPGLLEGLGTFFGAAMETGAKGMRDIYLEKMKEEALRQREENLQELRNRGAKEITGMQISSSEKLAGERNKMDQNQYNLVNKKMDQAFELQKNEAGFNAEQRTLDAKLRQATLDYQKTMAGYAQENQVLDKELRKETLSLSKQQLAAVQQNAKTDLEKTMKVFQEVNGSDPKTALNEAKDYLKSDRGKEIMAAGIARAAMAAGITDPNSEQFRDLMNIYGAAYNSTGYPGNNGGSSLDSYDEEYEKRKKGGAKVPTPKTGVGPMTGQVGGTPIWRY